MPCSAVAWLALLLLHSTVNGCGSWKSGKVEFELRELLLQPNQRCRRNILGVPSGGIGAVICHTQSLLEGLAVCFCCWYYAGFCCYDDNQKCLLRQYQHQSDNSTAFRDMKLCRARPSSDSSQPSVSATLLSIYVLQYSLASLRINPRHSRSNHEK